MGLVNLYYRIDIGTSGCASFACSDEKAIKVPPKEFRPKLPLFILPPLKPTPNINSGDNETTTVGTLAATVTGKHQITKLSNLTVKNHSENRTLAVTESTVLNSVDNQTTVSIQTTLTSILQNDIRTKLNVSTTSARLLLEQSTQTTVNEMKSKAPHISHLQNGFMAG